MVSYPFLVGDVPLSPSYDIYISQHVRLARVCSNVLDFRETIYVLLTIITPSFSLSQIRKKYLLNGILATRSAFVNISQHVEILYG